MSIECSECERDLRSGHDPECSRFKSIARRQGILEAALKCGEWADQWEYKAGQNDPKVALYSAQRMLEVLAQDSSSPPVQPPANIEIHGPQACPRPCVDCDPGHHWLPVCLDMSEWAGLDSEDYEAVLAFDRENGTEHALAFYACKHCPAWISDEDHDRLENDTLDDAETVYHIAAGDIWLQSTGAPLWEDEREPVALLEPMGAEILRLSASIDLFVQHLKDRGHAATCNSLSEVTGECDCGFQELMSEDVDG